MSPSRSVRHWSTALGSTALLITLICAVATAELHAQDDLAKRPVLYSVLGMDDVVIRSPVRYKTTGGESLSIDLYYPPRPKQVNRLAVVIFVFGYSDSAATKLTGAPLKTMGQYTSWPKLVAASGLVGITYATNQPEADLSDVVQYLRTHADELRIDASRIGLWACSANVPVALSYAMRGGSDGVKAGVFYYGLMPTPDGYQEARIDSLARQLGFAAPGLHGLSRLRSDVPLLVVRAGRDNIRGINASVDHFVDAAVAQNLPLTLINYSEGRHAFDILDDKPATRDIVRQTLTFLKTHLLPTEAGR